MSKPIYTGPRWISFKGGTKPIKMPQTPERPIALHTRDLVKWESTIKDDPYWFILHKRGVRRSKAGIDWLEHRAVPKEMIKGTLPERIVYKYLTSKLGFIPDVDFDFQSSLNGGRLEMGGIVADFVFYILKIVIQVQGPTHTEYLRVKKDSEQTDTLMEMGYRTILQIDMDLIYDEYRFEDYMRAKFGLSLSRGGMNMVSQNLDRSSGATISNTFVSGSGNVTDITTFDETLLQECYNTTMEIYYISLELQRMMRY